jgi:hypothetical protein
VCDFWGAFVVRPFDDDRQRLKAWVNIGFGFPLRESRPLPTDTLGSYGGMIGVGYEAAY